MHFTNEMLYAGIPRISTTIRERRLRFCGHCWRSKNEVVSWRSKNEVRLCGNLSMAKGTTEDRLAHLLMCWRRTPGSPETTCQQRWMTGLAGEIEPSGSNDVDLVVVFYLYY